MALRALDWTIKSVVTVFVVVYLLLFMMVGPSGRHGAAWPHGFHFWLIGAMLLVVLALLLACRAYYQNIVHHWASTSPDMRAVWLLCLLLFIQFVLGSAFWLTRDRGVDELGWLRAAFWMGGEFRIPGLFAVAQLFFAAFLSWGCFQLRRRIAWLLAALIFAFLGFDELMSIHEGIGRFLEGRSVVDAPSSNTVTILGLSVYTWILVYAPLVILVGGAMLMVFWRAVSLGELVLLAVAGGVFVGGAIGLEVMQAEGEAVQGDWWNSSAGHLNLLIEETLETLGVSIAIFVIARHFWRGVSSDGRQLET